MDLCLAPNVLWMNQSIILGNLLHARRFVAPLAPTSAEGRQRQIQPSLDKRDLGLEEEIGSQLG